MKPKNAIKRLEARQSAWTNMRTDSSSGPNKKTIHKPSGGILEFTKPGSLKRR